MLEKILDLLKSKEFEMIKIDIEKRLGRKIDAAEVISFLLKEYVFVYDKEV